jgi:cyclic pyranopterin phosphate synthase
MPEEEYVWLPRSSLLTFEEIQRLVAIFLTLGVRRVRLTGGEPLLRHDLPRLVGMLRALRGLEDLALTTNGVLLQRWAEPLKRAGLDRVTVSLDTLRPERMAAFARSDRHADVLAGLRAARTAGLTPVKVNTVVVRGFNEDEVIELIEFSRREGVEIRFIEYMDVGGATRWSADQVVSRAEILARVEQRFGPVEPVVQAGVPAMGEGTAPAERFRLGDGTTFGVIASVTAPFCRRCDRSRLTADGTWYLCLYADAGVELREPLRMGASDVELQGLIRGAWLGRRDRGAEVRLSQAARGGEGEGGRGVLYSLEELRRDPRREMHTRGG